MCRYEILTVTQLFDMDGTIIDSTSAIIKHWHRIGKEIGVDPEIILATSHGRRSIDVLEILEPKLATWECTLSDALGPSRGLPSGHSLITIQMSATQRERYPNSTAMMPSRFLDHVLYYLR